MEEKIEQAVIGSLILHPENFNEVSEIISDQDFKIDLYRHAFNTIKRMVEDNTEIDLISLYVEMGSPSGVSKISETVDDSFLPGKFYAEQLKKRNLQEQITQSTKEREYDEVQKRIKEYQDLGQPSTLYDIEKMMTETQSFKEYFETGFKDLDYYVKLYPTDLMVIAGRPSTGKTSFGLSVLANMAANIPVGLVSFEMGMNKIGRRLATMYSLDYLGKIHQNFIATSPSSFTLTETRKSIRSFISKNSTKIVMVDYLQLMKDSQKIESRRLEVTNLIRGLKELAKEFGIVVIVVSSLSRGTDHSENSRPTMNMLRESGDIEYAADVIVFLHQVKNAEMTELILDKNRDGKAKKIINLVWLEDKVRYGNYEWKEAFNN